MESYYLQIQDSTGAIYPFSDEKYHELRDKLKQEVANREISMGPRDVSRLMVYSESMMDSNYKYQTNGFCISSWHPYLTAKNIQGIICLLELKRETRRTFALVKKICQLYNIIGDIEREIIGYVRVFGGK